MMGNAKHKSADAKPCPTCGAPAMHETRPFCSKRCADVDLGRWFQGAYAIPAVDAADDSIIDAELAASGKMVARPGRGPWLINRWQDLAIFYSFRRNVGQPSRDTAEARLALFTVQAMRMWSIGAHGI